MPIIKSAKKRVKTAAKARARNAGTKRTLRDALKAFSKAVEAGKSAEISKTHREATSALDTAVKKAIIHKNKAARHKAALSARVKAAGVKPVKAAAKPKTSKPTSTKSSSKRTSSTKKAVKKPAKKPASKK